MNDSPAAAVPPWPKSAMFRQVAAWLAPSSWGTPAALPGGPIPWEQVIEASSHHVVTPALAWRLAGAPGMPQPVAEYLEATLFLNGDRNRQLLDGLMAVGARLNAAGIVPSLLKGSGLLAARIYPDSGMRFAGDLDLLIPQHQLETARDCLAGMGFAATEWHLDPDWHHLPMMVHGEWGVGVELHSHALIKPLVPIAEAGDLLARALPLAVDGVEFLLPEPTDRVVLAIAHGQIADDGHERGVPALRALLDVAIHQVSFGALIRWAEIERRFAAGGHLAVLHDTLALTEALMGMPSPLALPPQSRDAVIRLDATLDRPPPRKLFYALAALVRALPETLAKRPSQQLAALHRDRWRARLARHHPRW